MIFLYDTFAIDRIIYLKCLAHSLAHSKSPVKITSYHLLLLFNKHLWACTPCASYSLITGWKRSRMWCWHWKGRRQMWAKAGNAHKGNAPWNMVWVAAVVVVRSNNGNKLAQWSARGVMVESGRSFALCLPYCFHTPPVIPSLCPKPAPAPSALKT